MSVTCCWCISAGLIVTSRWTYLERERRSRHVDFEAALSGGLFFGPLDEGESGGEEDGADEEAGEVHLLAEEDESDDDSEGHDEVVGHREGAGGAAGGSEVPAEEAKTGGDGAEVE